MKRHFQLISLFVITLFIAQLAAWSFFGGGNAYAPSSASTIRYVATTGSDPSNRCASTVIPCATVLHAVDDLSVNDEIRVATGTYNDVQTKPKLDVNSGLGHPGCAHSPVALSARGIFHSR